MRRPTSLDERWGPWERAISGEDLPSISPDEYYNDIYCGFFKLRKFPYGQWPKGPWIPARVWMDEAEIDEAGELLGDEVWHVEIDGRRVNTWRAWPIVRARPITEDEFKWLTALSPLLPSKIPNR